MTTPKILLFYAIHPLDDPVAVKLWQRELCQTLGLTGRIIISSDGINGTLEGDVRACKAYIKRTREHPAFSTLKQSVKWSDGTGSAFPRLSVKVRPELVSFAAPGEVKVSKDGVIGGGTKLSPEEVDSLAASRDDVVFFDGRNAYEAEIGRFEGAVVADVRTTREFVAELESGKYDELRNRPIITYCTGGIRCEYLSALMKNRGFTDVYQIDGGIARYAETFGTNSLWKGNLAVFDGREVLSFSESPQLIATCSICSEPAGALSDCSVPGCNARFAVCEFHRDSFAPRLCSRHAD